MRNSIKIFLLTILSCLLSDVRASQPAQTTAVSADAVASSSPKIEYRAFLAGKYRVGIGAYNKDAGGCVGRIEYYYNYFGSPYILHMQVEEGWRRKKIATNLLAIALGNIRAKVPDADILLEVKVLDQPEQSGDNPGQSPASLEKLVDLCKKQGAIEVGRGYNFAGAIINMKFPAKK